MDTDIRLKKMVYKMWNTVFPRYLAVSLIAVVIMSIQNFKILPESPTQK